jgi:hypothetical protein
MVNYGDVRASIQQFAGSIVGTIIDSQNVGRVFQDFVKNRIDVTDLVIDW